MASGRARPDTRAVLYAADLDELRSWVGCADEARFRQARQCLREDEDSDWDPEELAVLERLLRRLVFEGKLYEGLADEERYYLTQLLIDLFDEFVDVDALSQDLPLQRLVELAEGLPRRGEAGRFLDWVVRGRELDGSAVIWQSGPVEDVLAYLGYVTRHEAGTMARALGELPATPRLRPGGLLRVVRGAAEECARAGLDLVSFVG